jgi:mRNA interferase RelE/StbE
VARVFLARSAREALAQLDLLRADAVLDALGELERDPEAGYELRGRLSGLWSYRVGAYRIIYERRGAKTVRVVAIRHRGQAYETDPRQ